MEQSCPIKLAFDETSILKSGGEGTLKWAVANCTDEALMQLTIEATSSNPSARLTPTTLDFEIPVGCWVDLSQYVDLRSTSVDHLLFRPSLKFKTRSGHEFQLRLPQELELRHLPKEGDTRTLEIIAHGDHLIDKADFSGFTHVRIKGEGQTSILNTRLGANTQIETAGGIHGDSQLKALCNAVERMPLTEKSPDTLREVTGFLVKVISPPAAPNGLSPLDLEKFAQAWPHQRDLSLSFVDRNGSLLGNEAKVRDIYRLSVQASRNGYLTLLAKGSSGAWYALAPNLHGKAEVMAHTREFWPGGLCQEPADQFEFSDSGEEWACALLTATPLMEPLAAVTPLVPEVISALLGQAHQQENAVLGIARIRINKTWH